MLLAGLCLAGLLTPAASEARLRVSGSTTVNPVVVDAAAVLRRERSLEIVIDTLGGSSGGIAALGDGRAEVAMASRDLNDADRTRYPNVAFHGTVIGVDALGLVVSRDVWEGGVRSLSRDEVRALYEGRIANWRELGGPDRRVVFFNKEPGRGTWEVFAEWAYGDAAKAPLVSLPEVGANEEARNKVSTTRGAITQLSAAWADGESTFAVAIETEGGDPVQPEAAAVTAGRYPLGRQLFLFTDGPPAGEAKVLIDFLLSPTGQELLGRHGYLPVPEP